MLSAALCDHISRVPYIKDHKIKIVNYCYHLIDVITFELVQSDHIKRLLLYFEKA